MKLRLLFAIFYDDYLASGCLRHRKGMSMIVYREGEGEDASSLTAVSTMM